MQWGSTVTASYVDAKPEDRKSPPGLQTIGTRASLKMEAKRKTGVWHA